MNEHLVPRHILFVDDDPASQRSVERVLRAGVPDVKVSCLSSGVQALQVLQRGYIDLLITDLHMPGMDGMELLRQVASRRITLPVIVVADHGSPSHETRALADGAFEYFEKPIEADPFIRCVKELLDDARHRSRIEGLSIAGFVQLLSMERKTCALRASVPGAQGVLFFTAGALIDAHQGELSGVEAALEIFTWRDPIITLEALTRSRAETIHLGVTELLLESARVADERSRSGSRGAPNRPHPEPPAAPPAPAARGPTVSLVPAIAEPRRPTPRPAPAPESPKPRPAALSSTAAAAPVAAARASPSPRIASWEEPDAQAAFNYLLTEAMKIDGVTAAVIANWELDHSVGILAQRPDPRLDLAVSGDCRVMRALMAAMARLGLEDQVKDILITLDEHSHILWPLPDHERLFLCLAVERSRGNLALTRHRLAKIFETDTF